MVRPVGQLLVSLFFVILCFSVIATPGMGSSIREPVWAGRFYPSNRQKLLKTIEELQRQVKHSVSPIPGNKPLKALILPHAGYIYSGRTAAYASHVLHKGLFNKVILIGPDHRVGFQNGAVSEVTHYRTPLGDIPLHDDTRLLKQHSRLFQSIPASDRSEHSLEVILPYLQYFLGEFKLVPSVLGPCQTSTICDALTPLIDADTLLVISSDLSHFLPYAQAVKRDHETIGHIVKLEDEPFSFENNRACGRYGIQVVIELARRHNWQPVLLHYSNRGDSAGGRG